MQDLIPIESPNPAALFAPQGLNDILARIATEARALAPDLRTKRGRDAIASNAAKVARAKTYLDGIGKEYVAALKALPAQVDAERKRARDFLDALRDEVRRPLTEFEDAERARVADLERRLAELEGAADLDPAADAATIAARLAVVEGIGIGDDWQEFAQIAAGSKNAALLILQNRHAAALEAERRAAERLRLEREQDAAEQAAREARIAGEAARRATEEAEARGRAQQEAAEARAREVEQQRQAAERRAVEAEQEAARAAEQERARLAAEQQAAEQEAARRARDRTHAAEVHNAIAADLCAVGIGEALARDVVRALVAGRVRHVAVTY